MVTLIYEVENYDENGPNGTNINAIKTTHDQL